MLTVPTRYSNHTTYNNPQTPPAGGAGDGAALLPQPLPRRRAGTHPKGDLPLYIYIFICFFYLYLSMCMCVFSTTLFHLSLCLYYFSHHLVGGTPHPEGGSFVCPIVVYADRFTNTQPHPHPHLDPSIQTRIPSHIYFTNSDRQTD